MYNENHTSKSFVKTIWWFSLAPRSPSFISLMTSNSFPWNCLVVAARLNELQSCSVISLEKLALCSARCWARFFSVKSSLIKVKINKNVDNEDREHVYVVYTFRWWWGGGGDCEWKSSNNTGPTHSYCVFRIHWLIIVITSTEHEWYTRIYVQLT